MEITTYGQIRTTCTVECLEDSEERWCAACRAVLDAQMREVMEVEQRTRWCSVGGWLF
ncbi:hypothetical protein [Actinomadura litoris]|uniref:hypothetical protein n=1 Tax=Actinomadura litoris TaxID=2678616 RepID=UPI001FA76A12|nr:hypothetical protein [Actinomadura litoris]